MMVVPGFPTGHLYHRQCGAAPSSGRMSWRTKPISPSTLHLTGVDGGFANLLEGEFRGYNSIFWLCPAEMVGAVELYAQSHEFGTVCDQSRYVI